MKSRKKAKKAVSTKPAAKKSPAKKPAAKRLDDLLDAELEESFPASDPLELTEPGGARKATKPRKKKATGKKAASKKKKRKS